MADWGGISGVNAVGGFLNGFAESYGEASRQRALLAQHQQQQLFQTFLQLAVKNPTITTNPGLHNALRASGMDETNVTAMTGAYQLIAGMPEVQQASQLEEVLGPMRKDVLSSLTRQPTGEVFAAAPPQVPTTAGTQATPQSLVSVAQQPGGVEQVRERVAVAERPDVRAASTRQRIAGLTKWERKLIGMEADDVTEAGSPVGKILADRKAFLANGGATDGPEAQAFDAALGAQGLSPRERAFAVATQGMNAEQLRDYLKPSITISSATGVERERIAHGDATMERLKRLKDLYRSVGKKNIGPARGRVNSMRDLLAGSPGTLSDFIAESSLMRNDLIQEYGQSQVPPPEEARLDTMIPLIKDPPRRWEAKFNAYVSKVIELRAMRMDAIRSFGRGGKGGALPTGNLLEGSGAGPVEAAAAVGAVGQGTATTGDPTFDAQIRGQFGTQ